MPLTSLKAFDKKKSLWTAKLTKNTPVESVNVLENWSSK